MQFRATIVEVQKGENNMKKTLKTLIAGILCFALTACGSSSSAPKESEEQKEPETAAETKTEEESKEEEAKEEVKEAASWEVGEATITTWTDSIGSRWAQIICPVTNTGTKNLYLSTGTMDLEDADGHLVDSLSMVSVFPDVIQPDETGYYYEETILDEGTPEGLSVLPHVKVKEATIDCIRYDVSEVNVADEQYGGIKITGRVANSTDEDASLVYVTAFLYDSEDHMIASAFTILTDDLVAGDKVGFSMSTFSAPDTLTAGSVDHYEVYAYPTQYQF